MKSQVSRNSNLGLLRDLDPTVATSGSLSSVFVPTLADQLPSAPKSPSASAADDYFGGPANALAGPPSLGPIPPENAPIADLLANPSVGGEGQPVDDGGNALAPALVQDVATPFGGGLASCAELSPAWSDDYWSRQGGSASSQGASGEIVDPTVLAAADQAANLGAAGGWCRPGNEAFVDSSPFVNGSVWTLTLIVAIGASILLISRGWRLPA